jgi:nitric oxide reductase subunit B
MAKLWLTFAAVLVVSFAVLGWVGTRIYQQAPPLPDRVVTSAGNGVIPSGDIEKGQNVWQSMGGMEVGSIWGHGSYVAPDWTADWLHRECVFILDDWARAAHHKDYDQIDPEQQAALQKRLELMMRENTFDPATGAITVAPVRARAFEANLRHYADVFGNGHAGYAIPKGAQPDPERLRQLAAFFFWTSWAASTNRPGVEISWTSNWPHEPLIGNRPTGDAVVWTGVSVLMLLAGLGAMIWWYASQSDRRSNEPTPQSDPIIGWRATPSQRATVKYFYVVAVMILAQILLGIITAHYGVEGDGFYGIPLSKWLPYSVTRTWHLQLGVLWIATAWLATGLFIGPLVRGDEPRGQKLGVDLLFVALLVIVGGSLAGQWLSIQNHLSDEVSFYFGHQGYEYIDLGRAWQIGLFVGLLLWLGLVVRVVGPALKRAGEQKHLLLVFLMASAAIGLFYAAGFAWGRHTHLSIVEYWRWWVIHLWVEGFFEVFATAVIAFFFARLNLVTPRLAAQSSLLSATIYLSGGIIGTLHHLYFAGTPTVALAFGSVFSALEVVPLLLIAYPAWEDIRMSKATVWVRRYKWPIWFFVAVAFWNMLGAGLFGFMINPPIALYYMQGLNTTPVHAHAALFGVYGMLGIGLMLMCLRALLPQLEWREGLLKFSFWSMNVGLFAMVVVSLLPVGLMQTWASVTTGYWYARSPEFLQTDVMQTLRWLRVPGDTIFALGTIALVLFVLRLKTGQPPTVEQPIESEPKELEAVR